MIGSMFQLTNAQGITVDIQSSSLRAYTPVGLGMYVTNTYSAYNAGFIRTNSQLTDPTSNPYEVYIQFGDVSSQSYQSFADFASFLAYPPYTLSYTTDAGTWYRNANLQSITKTEIGGSTVIAADRLNEAFILEFYTAWYQLQSQEYISYNDDPTLAIYGKIYNTIVSPSTGNPNLIVASTVTANSYLSTTGTVITQATGPFTTDYIAVTPGSQITVTIPTIANGVIRICEYDTGKNYVTRQVTSTAGITTQTFTLSSTTAYIRFSPNALGSTSIPYGSPYKVEIGDEATPWDAVGQSTTNYPTQQLVNSSGTNLATITDNGYSAATIQVSGNAEVQNSLVSVSDSSGNVLGSQQLNTNPNPDQIVASTNNTILVHDNSDGTSTVSTTVAPGQSIQVTQTGVGSIYNQSNLGYNNLAADSEMLDGLKSGSDQGWNAADSISSILTNTYVDSSGNSHNAIQMASTSGSNSNVLVSENITPTLNSTYYWSVYYKVTSALSSAATVNMEGRTGTVSSNSASEAESLVSTSKTVGGWTLLTGSFKPTSSSTNFLRLRFQNLGTGTIQFSCPQINLGSQLNSYTPDTIDTTQWSLNVPDGYSYSMLINAHEVDFKVLPQNTGYNFSFTFPRDAGNYVFNNSTETFDFVIGSNFSYLYPYVYFESNRNLDQKSMSVSNDSKYFGFQQGSPCVITVTGPTTTNVNWKVIQDGTVVASDGFNFTLTDNQRLVVSSYPDDQYARIYNPDNSYSDVSQYQDITKTNYALIPEGNSIIVFYVDKTAGVQFTYKEERLLV